MNTRLDPAVARKLDRFRRRRAVLLFARGVAAGVAAFLVGMLPVALADWYWLLEDRTRWVLSGAVYLLTAAAVWWACAASLRRRPARGEVAGLMEAGAPDLRDRLRSAVELAADDPAAVHDSPHFRGMLQGAVAERMARVRVRDLLPVRLVGRWLAAAAVLAALAAVLLTAGGEPVRRLATRAVLPGANVARVSRTRVEVLEPTPHSLTLAAGDTVAVVVSVDGAAVDGVTLETVTDGGDPAARPMGAREDVARSTDVYAANLTLGDDAVEYRVRAGDAVTARYRIDTRPRPRVVSFRKRYRFPDYAGLPDETVTEPDGDLVVLAGTAADLTLELDQPASAAELRLDLDGGDRVVPLVPAENDDGTRWAATVPVDDSGVYTVHLVAADTGFDNPFAPKHEVRAVPDLLPRAAFVDQPEPTLLLPPNDLLSLRGAAEDDLPLASLEQHIAVNGGEWRSVPLDPVPAGEANAGRTVRAAWDWDLLDLRLSAGDQVLTKLVATDRAGHTGESPPLRVVVADAGFDPDRHAVMRRKLALQDDVAAFASLLEEQRDTAKATLERLGGADVTDGETAADHALLGELVTRQRNAAGTLRATLEDALRSMPAGADAHDLDLAGRLVAKLELERTGEQRDRLGALTARAENAGKLRDELRRGFEQSAEEAAVLARRYQDLAAHDLVAAAAGDLDAVRRGQQLVADGGDRSWDRLVRQETLVRTRLDGLERTVREQLPRLGEEVGREMTRLLEHTAELRVKLETASEVEPGADGGDVKEKQVEQLRRASDEVLRSLDDRRWHNLLHGKIAQRLVEAHKDLHARAGDLFTPIGRTAEAAERADRADAAVVAAADSGEGASKAAEARRAAAELDLKHSPTLDQLRARRDLTQSRPDADPRFAADAGLTHRAVTAVLDARGDRSSAASTDAEPVDTPAALREIAAAFRTLEAGHELEVARRALDVLLKGERWGSQSPAATLDHPRQWDAYSKTLELAADRLQKAGVRGAVDGLMNEARWSQPSQRAGRTITERRWKREETTGAADDLREVGTRVDAVRAAVAPAMDEARAVIAKYAPTIPRMARAAAAEVRENEAATLAAADRADSTDTPPDVAALRREQAAADARLADLFDALAEDAGTRELTDDEQRDRARDADAAAALVREPADLAARALDDAARSPTSERRAEALAEAAERQEDTAAALDLVAEHFDRLDEGSEIADTRERLRAAERDLGIARELDRRFEPAERLAAASRQDADERLADLEAELDRNPAMREELSAIAENTLRDAKNALEQSATDEVNLQRDVERGDTDFRARKEEVARQVRELGAEAGKLSRELVAQAERSADRGKTPDARQALKDVRQSLDRASAEANRAQGDERLADLAAVAERVRGEITAAAETLAVAKADTARGKDEAMFEKDADRDRERKSSERSRDQFRDQQRRSAEQTAKQREDSKRRADQNLKRAEDEVRRAEDRVRKAERESKQKPDDDGRKRRVEQEEARLGDARRKVEDERETVKQAGDVAKAAREDVEAVKRRPRPPLDAANPAAQLADRYTGEAVETAESLKQRADAAAAAADFADELAPPARQFAQSGQRQEQITAAVAGTAEQVARAARHEDRLKNPANAAALAEAAAAIDAVVDTEAAAAQAKLAAAGEEAETRRGDGAENPGGENGAARAAAGAVTDAERAIAARAEQLAGTLEERPAAAAAGESPDGGAPAAGVPAAPAAPPSSAEQARGRELARTLDELDRRAAAGRGDQPADAAPGAGERALFAAASRAQQSAAASQRSAAQQRANSPTATATAEAGAEPTDQFSDPAASPDLFAAAPADRTGDAEWGALRARAAEDVTAGRGDAVAEDYRAGVDAYFRVLAERARGEK